MILSRFATYGSKALTHSLPLDSILQGNSLELLKTIPDSSIDLIFADPPYFMQVDGTLNRPEGEEFSGCDDEWDKFENLQAYLHFSREWLTQCYRILKPSGSIWVIGSMQCIYALGGIMQELGFWFINDVIWHKSNPTPNFHGTRLNNAHETLLWATKSKKSKYTFHYKTAKELHSEIVGFERGQRRQLGSVWRLSVCNGNERLKDSQGAKLHNTQKPESLLYRIIAISSKLGDVVLDPFGGTMTTGAVAKRLGRAYIMLEQNARYVEAGKARLDSIHFADNPIARAEFDKRPAKVSLKELIESGFLRVGENLYLKDAQHYATLTPQGRALYEGQEYDIHSLCAKLKNAKASRLNGFLYLEVLREDEKGAKRVKLFDLRESYRAQNPQAK